jgi:hypothetical protein
LTDVCGTDASSQVDGFEVGCTIIEQHRIHQPRLLRRAADALQTGAISSLELGIAQAFRVAAAEVDDRGRDQAIDSYRGRAGWASPSDEGPRYPATPGALPAHVA